MSQGRVALTLSGLEICVVEPLCMIYLVLLFKLDVSVLVIKKWIIAMYFKLLYLSSKSPLLLPHPDGNSPRHHIIPKIETPRLAKNGPTKLRSASPTSAFIPGSAPSSRVNPHATCKHTSPAYATTSRVGVAVASFEYVACSSRQISVAPVPVPSSAAAENAFISLKRLPSWPSSGGPACLCKR
jgi:hypothetical protein